MPKSRDFHAYWDLRKFIFVSPYLVVSFQPGYLTHHVVFDLGYVVGVVLRDCPVAAPRAQRVRGHVDVRAAAGQRLLLFVDPAAQGATRLIDHVPSAD